MAELKEQGKVVDFSVNQQNAQVMKGCYTGPLIPIDQLPSPKLTPEEVVAIEQLRKRLQDYSVDNKQQQQSTTEYTNQRFNFSAVDCIEDPKFIPADDGTLVRFLRARKLDIELTLKMYLKYSEWYVEKQVGQILLRPHPNGAPIQYSISHGLHGCDKHGRPVYFQRTGKMHVHEFTHGQTDAELAMGHTWYLENCIHSLRNASIARGERQHQIVIILDMDGVGLQHRKTVHQFSITSFIDQNYYPEMLGAMYMINCPSFFPVLYNLAKIFLDKKTQEKIHVLGRNYQPALIEALGADCIPQFWGGNCQCVGGCVTPIHAHEEAKKAIAAAAAARGNNKVDGDTNKDEADDSNDLLEQTVGRRDRFEVKLETPYDDETLYRWKVQVPSHDIGFSVHWFPSAHDDEYTEAAAGDNNNNGSSSVAAENGNNAESKSNNNNNNNNNNNLKEENAVQVFAYQRLTSANSKNEYEGEFLAKGRGVCRFVWDNTYSMFTSKTIRYSVSTVHPSER